jgi:hypothetical protein
VRKLLSLLCLEPLAVFGRQLRLARRSLGALRHSLEDRGFGTRKLGWMLNLLLLNHVGTETGEIAVLKGIQGATGYPL